MNEIVLAGILFIAIAMILSSILIAAEAWLAPVAVVTIAGETSEPSATGTQHPSQPRICKVLSSRSVAPMMREIVLTLTEGERIDFTAGDWVEVTAPSFATSYSEYALPAEHRASWDRMGLWGLSVDSARRETRRFWIANTPEDGSDWIVLLVRLALPPPDRPELPPGKVSSWAFGLRAGDTVAIAGPFGAPAAREDDSEIIMIGAGYGVAPIRAILSDRLNSKARPQKISLWYGARTAIDFAYGEELDRLAAAHAGFTWHGVIAEPAGDGGRAFETGLVHEVLRRNYLAGHPAPEDCRYLLFGPPLMIGAALAMLEGLGVEADRIHCNGEAAG